MWDPHTNSPPLKFLAASLTVIISYIHIGLSLPLKVSTKILLSDPKKSAVVITRQSEIIVVDLVISAVTENLNNVKHTTANTSTLGQPMRLS